MKIALDFDQIDIPTVGSPLIDINSSTLSVGEIVGKIFPIVVALAGLLLLIAIVLAGFEYMLAMDDPKKAEAAKNRLTNGIVGFAAVLISLFVLEIFGKAFGITPITELFGP